MTLYVRTQQIIFHDQKILCCIQCAECDLCDNIIEWIPHMTHNKSGQNLFIVFYDSEIFGHPQYLN